MYPTFASLSPKSKIQNERSTRYRTIKIPNVSVDVRTRHEREGAEVTDPGMRVGERNSRDGPRDGERRRVVRDDGLDGRSARMVARVEQSGRMMA